MEKEKFVKLEKKANELFGEKAVVSAAEVKVANKGYIVRVKMQGMPFEISAMHDTLEKAEELALAGFNTNMEDALKNSLFPTQAIEKYKEVKLDEDQFTRLFKNEDLLSKEYTNELKEKTIAKICQLDDGRYECVLESPYMCLHARGTGGTEKLSILTASMNAHDIFRTPLVQVGKKPWNR